MGSFWDADGADQRREELIALWNGGRSSQWIADIMGISRSAVIGKIYRLRKAGVLLRGENEHPNAAAFQQRSRKRRLYPQKDEHGKFASFAKAKDKLLAKLMAEARANKARETRPAHDKPLIKSILDLERNHCRFPIGEIRDIDFGFCGRERVPGLPYCQDCAAVAFVAPDPSRPTRVIGWEPEPIDIMRPAAEKASVKAEPEVVTG